MLDPRLRGSYASHRTPRRRTSRASVDAYVERCVKPAALKSTRSISRRIAVRKEHLGELRSTRSKSPTRSPVQERMGLRRRGGAGDDPWGLRNAAPRDDGTTSVAKAFRLLADGVDIRVIQLMRGHASIQQTQRRLNVTDEELRRGLGVSWNNKGRPLSPREREMLNRYEKNRSARRLALRVVPCLSHGTFASVEVWLRGRDLKSIWFVLLNW